MDVMDNLCHLREFVPFWTGEVHRVAKHQGHIRRSVSRFNEARAKP